MRVSRNASVTAISIAAVVVAGTPVTAQESLRPLVYVSGLTSPVAFVQDPTNPAVQFVVEQGGRIRVVQSGTVQATDFLDLRGVISSGGERGLLGMALCASLMARAVGV